MGDIAFDNYYRGYAVRRREDGGIDILRQGELLDSTPVTMAEARSIVDEWLAAR